MKNGIFLSLNGFVVLWIRCVVCTLQTFIHFLKLVFSNLKSQTVWIVKSNSNRNKKGFVAFLIGNSVNMKLKSFLSVKVAWLNKIVALKMHLCCWNWQKLRAFSWAKFSSKSSWFSSFSENIDDIQDFSFEILRERVFFHEKKSLCKSEGPTEIWTRIAGFKVQSANHYTMGPILWEELKNYLINF